MERDKKYTHDGSGIFKKLKGRENFFLQEEEDILKLDPSVQPRNVFISCNRTVRITQLQNYNFNIYTQMVILIFFSL